MVTFRVLPRPTLAPACSPLPEPNSSLTPLFSHSCEILAKMHQKRANNPFRITFLKNGVRTNHLDSHSCAKPPGGGYRLPHPCALRVMGRTDRIGMQPKDSLWD